MRCLKMSLVALVVLSLSLPVICSGADSGKIQISRDELAAVSKRIQKTLENYPKEDTSLYEPIGSSHQPSLTAEVDLLRFKTDEAQRSIVGVYLTDALYSALSGKIVETVDYLKACRKLVVDNGLGEIVDLGDLEKKDQVIPEDPSKMTAKDFEKLIIYSDELVFKIFLEAMADPQGIVWIADVTYGAAVEGLYLISQEVQLRDGAKETLLLMANEQKSMDFILQLVADIETNAALKQACRLDEKRKILEPVAALLKEKGEALSKEDTLAVLNMILPARKKLVTGH